MMQKIFKKFISNRDVEFLDSSLFAVVTITPYFPKKEVNTYIMDRDGIEGFFEGYEEYAEYVVSIQPLFGFDEDAFK